MTWRKRLATLVLLVGISFSASSCSLMNDEWHHGCRVVDKNTLYGSSGDGNTHREYRLTTTCGSFAVEDTIGTGYDTWDKWAAIDVGQTYDIQTRGFRSGFFSMFPVVKTIEERPNY